jgi:hypothetical protein
MKCPRGERQQLAWTLHAQRSDVGLLFRASWLAITCAILLISGCAAIKDRSSRTKPNAVEGAAGAAAEQAADDAAMPNFAQASERCSADGAQACAKHGTRDLLTCQHGVWQPGASCPEDQRCDSLFTSQRGPCRPFAPECASRKPRAMFCDEDEKLQSCQDAIFAEALSCGELEHCVTVDDRPRCACVLGAIDQGSGCQIATSCGTQGGGCDGLTMCRMDGNERTCTDCPDGYVGTGLDGCEPLLSNLHSSCGEVTPALAPDVREYRSRVSVLCQQLQLTATIPSGARLEVNGVATNAAAGWTSDLLEVGENPIELRITSKTGGSSTYKLGVERVGAQASYIKPSNSGAGDSLGLNLAASGDTLIAGAVYEDSRSPSEPNDDGTMDSGAAYVYVSQNDSWSEQAILKADDAAAGDFFGTDVAISGDTAVVGAPRFNPLRLNILSPTGRGTAYVFTRNSGIWTQQAKLVPPMAAAGDFFGARVTLDGDTAFVGALTDDDGANDSGAVYVFQRSGDVWNQVQKLKPAKPAADAMFGLAIAVEKETLLIGAAFDSGAASKAGAVYAFARRGGMWQEVQRFQASPAAQGATFGWDIGLQGETAVISAAHVDLVNPTLSGEVYVFDRAGDQWTQSAMLVASTPKTSDLYGSSLAFRGSTLVVGANGESSGSRGAKGDSTRTDAIRSGAAYVYARSGKDWVLTAYLKAANADAEDGFGQAVVLTDEALWVSAPFEAGQSHGINGDENTNGAPKSGALYVYR